MTKMEYAYIFDFDGVLINSMEAHFASYQEALKEVNVPLDKDKFYSNAGMTGKEQIAFFADKANVKVDVEKVYARKGQLWDKYTDRITKIPSNLELLKCLRTAGYRTAIATGSTPGSIVPIMKKYQIEVDVVVTAEDIKRGKPYPDLFLCASGKLDYAPEKCIVVEDSDVGIEAAQAAGMKAMRFYNR
jgi:beta-phosphoglucomutase-like phosphatase (HAD superfamily)